MQGNYDLAASEGWTARGFATPPSLINIHISKETPKGKTLFDEGVTAQRLALRLAARDRVLATHLARATAANRAVPTTLTSVQVCEVHALIRKTLNFTSCVPPPPPGLELVIAAPPRPYERDPEYNEWLLETFRMHGTAERLMRFGHLKPMSHEELANQAADRTTSIGVKRSRQATGQPLTDGPCHNGEDCANLEFKFPHAVTRYACFICGHGFCGACYDVTERLCIQCRQEL